MNIFVDKKWRSGFLDYHQDKEEYRIQVIAWKNLEKIEDAYFVRPKSIKILINYLKKFGLSVVIRKVISRLQEKYRNEKFISCGVGKIIGEAKEGVLKKGDIVGFIAPLHPPLVEKLVLPEKLITKMNLPSSLTSKKIIFYKPLGNERSQQEKWWAELKGWTKYAGIEIQESTIQKIKENIEKTIRKTDWDNSVKLNPSGTKISEIKELRKKSLPNRKKAVLFGYGNYAKTQIIPNIKEFLAIEAIHEIDPTQIPLTYRGAARWDTSPHIRSEEKYDVFIIAGYHHTHAPLAVEALKRGAYALVEKPAVVDEKQLEKLIDALKKFGEKVIVGFHKRYSPFNKFLMNDINQKEPINYHCIVYEEPQPAYYWYNWPNSKGPIVSNGCHWIDHFLYINNFKEPVFYDVKTTKDGRTLNAVMKLENDSFFTMAFTEKGGSSIGVQDYVEIRNADKTIRIINDSLYEAENKKGVVRRKKINKAENYKAMYKQISKKIAAGESGDSLKSIEVSSRAMLMLQKIYESQLQKSKN